MSDGTVLKANVYRPTDVAGRPIDTPTPTIVNLTPYTKLVSNILDSAISIPWLGEAILDLFRRFDLTGTPLAGITDITKAFGTGLPRTLAVDRNLIESGYTQIVVDVRGTGFSEGTVQFFGQREQQDTVEVIDWASRQPWSNGSIGMSGVSYSAVDQIQAADKQPPALKAIFPVEPGSDLMHDILAPGGGLNAGFVPGWLAAVDATKLVPRPGIDRAGTVRLEVARRPGRQPADLLRHADRRTAHTGRRAPARQREIRIRREQSAPIDVHLNTVYDATDGYWSATLNDVAPDGLSTVLSTGQLVVSLRAIDPGRSTRSADGDLTGPYTKLTLDSRQPVVPGQPTTIDLALTPTDAILQPGHRLRADVYASNFPKGLPVLLFPFLADTRLQPQHLDLDTAAPSFVNVPIGGAPGW
ncbi:CocE/NonD family hydrolase [Nocardia terpenica]|uniref:CocE/NonD family hydrolase n=1 Tax=Nocardia terpenica TaxID=455432 RepID=UPI001EE9B7E7|nr:CocE/NonD family hydrolase [Nocardia terpenica]